MTGEEEEEVLGLWTVILVMQHIDYVATVYLHQIDIICVMLNFQVLQIIYRSDWLFIEKRFWWLDLDKDTFMHVPTCKNDGVLHEM